MSVYVDAEMIVWEGREWCHLVADSLDELHRFASGLGLKYDWFQVRSYPHYDVTDRMREKALLHGALPGDRITIMRCARSLQHELSLQPHPALQFELSL